MTKHLIAAALAIAFLAVSAGAPTIAEEKKLTSQQQKMKDCAAKWKEEKAKNNVKGRDAYNKFMSGCLKS
jgi:hypothetical protein